MPLVTCPHGPTTSTWEEDRRLGVFRQPPSEPYFDNQIGAWVLSRHADVVAAFTCADLQLVGPASRTLDPPVDEPARLKMRAETRGALSTHRLRLWRKQMLLDARDCAAQFAP